MKMRAHIFRGTIIGPTGAGKGTLSERIAKLFNIQHISSGDILRKHIIDSTNLGKLVEDYLAEGSLVPDKLIHHCLTEAIEKGGDRFLLDGYPRTITQAKYLSDLVELNNCIYLNVPFHVIIKRLSTRMIHLPSGRVYNIGFHEPKVKNKDDETGEPLSHRKDDRPLAVIRRLRIYETITVPMIKYYKDKHILHEFTGKKTNEIWPHLKHLLETELKY